jgi:hypothetical protein
MALKENEAQELLKFLNLSEAETIDEAKEKFSAAWIKSEELSSKIGRVTGSIANVARKAFEPFGVIMTEEDFKDKKIEDVIRGASEKAKESFEAQREEWEKRASGNGSEAVIQEWEKKYKTLEKKSVELDGARQDAITQFDQYKEKVKTDQKASTINSVFEKELSAIKLDPSVSEITIRGFKSVIADKYVIDLEEDGSPIMKDKTSGERLKSTAKAGQFLAISEVLLKEATDAGIIQKNPHAGKTFGSNAKPTFQQGQGTTAADQKVRTVNPRFMGI